VSNIGSEPERPLKQKAFWGFLTQKAGMGKRKEKKERKRKKQSKQEVLGRTNLPTFPT
jgi:hypothetical protein